jgi:hypothetical protein
MKKLAVFVILFLMIILLNSCNKEKFTWENKEFKSAIDYYCKYIDSSNYYEQNFDYMYIKAAVKSDSTVFMIYLDGGAYIFLTETSSITDFFVYNKHDVLLTGDFPNKIVNIKKNKRLNIIDDILKVRYPSDYKKYLHDKSTVGPLIYDYMNMTIIFKENKLISCKRQYY